MQERLPLQLQQQFKCHIISSQLIYRADHKTYYNCATNFGNMTLIIEQLFSSIHTSLITDNHSQNNIIKTPQQFLQRRNQILSKNLICNHIPLIYEQYIVNSHKDRSICFTLIEPVEIISFNQLRRNIKIQEQQNLFSFLFQLQLQKTDFQLLLPSQTRISINMLLKSALTQKIYFDFTDLKYVGESLEKQNLQRLKHKKQQIKNFLREFQLEQKGQKKQKGINQLILIKDKIFQFSSSLLLNYEFHSWFEVCLMLNYISEFQIKVKVKQKNIEGVYIQKKKSIPIKKMAEIITKYEISSFQFNGLTFDQFNFYGDYCINLLKQVTYQNLLTGFFVDEVTYFLKKSIYLTVNILHSHQNSDNFAKNNGDRLFIESGIPKLECINYFITYFKYIDPVLTKVVFNKIQNSLTFQFLGKLKKKRKIKIIFYPQYLIKDEQLSMILQKSKLEDCQLNLNHMAITDSFLMFLANSEKMKKIKALDISYCQRITENGVNSLMISPFCKCLEILNVSGAPIIQSSIDSISLKTKLKQLYMNNCSKEDINEETFNVKNLNLIKFEALGMHIQPLFSMAIQYLKIDIEVSIQVFKQFKDFALKELTIKLSEHKKHIMGLLSNLYIKQSNPVRLFAEGKSSKTLRYLNISDSKIKLKSIKNLFHMSELEILVIDNISENQQIEFHISPNVLNLSLKNSNISYKQLLHLLKSTKIMAKLNITNTLLNKRQIVEFFSQTQKYVNTLIISEDQYSQNLINSHGNSSQFIETFEIVISQTLFQQYRHHILSDMLFRISKSNKIIKFRQKHKKHHQKDSPNYSFQHQAYEIFRKCLFDVKLCKNLYIGDKSFNEILLEQKQKQKNKIKNNCEQFLRVYQSFKKPKTFYFNQNYFLIEKIKQDPKSDSFKQSNQISQKFQTVTYFTYFFNKIIRNQSQDIFQLSLLNNRTMNCVQILKMILAYCPEPKLKSVDFRNIISSNYEQLFSRIIEIPYIQSLNEQQYEFILNSKNFIERSQKYLKFFMRILNVKSLKFKCSFIYEADILFSILFHIIDHHCETIQSISCEFENIKMNYQNSSSFWAKLSELKQLKHLQIKLQNSPSKFLRQVFEVNSLEKMELSTLKLIGFHFESIPLLKNTKKLKQVSLSFENSEINEMNLTKILKQFHSSSKLESLSLNCNLCDQLTQLNRLSHVLRQFTKLKSLMLSFQYCSSLKDSLIIDFLEGLSHLKKMSYAEINLSFLMQNSSITQVIKVFKNIRSQLLKCYFKIYLIGPGSKDIELKQFYEPFNIPNFQKSYLYFEMDKVSIKLFIQKYAFFNDFEYDIIFAHFYNNLSFSKNQQRTFFIKFIMYSLHQKRQTFKQSLRSKSIQEFFTRKREQLLYDLKEFAREQNEKQTHNFCRRYTKFSPIEFAQIMSYDNFEAYHDLIINYQNELEQYFQEKIILGILQNISMRTLQKIQLLCYLITRKDFSVFEYIELNYGIKKFVEELINFVIDGAKNKLLPINQTCEIQFREPIIQEDIYRSGRFKSLVCFSLIKIWKQKPRYEYFYLMTKCYLKLYQKVFNIFGVSLIAELSYQKSLIPQYNFIKNLLKENIMVVEESKMFRILEILRNYIQFFRLQGQQTHSRQIVFQYIDWIKHQIDHMMRQVLIEKMQQIDFLQPHFISFQTKYCLIYLLFTTLNKLCQINQKQKQSYLTQQIIIMNQQLFNYRQNHTLIGFLLGQAKISLESLTKKNIFKTLTYYIGFLQVSQLNSKSLYDTQIKQIQDIFEESQLTWFVHFH